MSNTKRLWPSVLAAIFLFVFVVVLVFFSISTLFWYFLFCFFFFYFSSENPQKWDLNESWSTFRFTLLSLLTKKISLSTYVFFSFISLSGVIFLLSLLLLGFFDISFTHIYTHANECSSERFDRLNKRKAEFNTCLRARLFVAEAICLLQFQLMIFVWLILSFQISMKIELVCVQSHMFLTNEETNISRRQRNKRNINKLYTIALHFEFIRP